MMTSRAEYRLLLRQDNADIRLYQKGYDVGLLSEERYNYVSNKITLINNEIERLKSVTVGGNEKVNTFLYNLNSTPLNNGITLAELIKRPELNYDDLKELDSNRPLLSDDVREQVNINLKYEGYISRELRQVEHFKKLEGKIIPDNIDYDDIGSLRLEARQKLKNFMPRSIGQASRISGVSPADISVLLVYMEQKRR